MANIVIIVSASWDGVDQNQWSEITQIMVDQMNQWILVFLSRVDSKERTLRPLVRNLENWKACDISISLT